MKKYQISIPKSYTGVRVINNRDHISCHAAISRLSPSRLAYRTLLKLRINKLPVDILGICRRCKNTKVMTFREADKEFPDYSGFLIGGGPSESAFTMKPEIADIKWNFILYNDDMMYNSLQRLRFSLAHELGHIVLGHKDEHSFICEAEANCFAQHLLCPVPVVEAMNLCDHSKIFLFSKVFGVSRSVAIIVLDSKNLMADVDLDMQKGICELFWLDEGGAQKLLDTLFENIIKARLG